MSSDICALVSALESSGNDAQDRDVQQLLAKLSDVVLHGDAHEVAAAVGAVTKLAASANRCGSEAHAQLAAMAACALMRTCGEESTGAGSAEAAAWLDSIQRHMQAFTAAQDPEHAVSLLQYLPAEVAAKLRQELAAAFATLQDGTPLPRCKYLAILALSGQPASLDASNDDVVPQPAHFLLWERQDPLEVAAIGTLASALEKPDVEIDVLTQTVALAAAAHCITPVLVEQVVLRCAEQAHGVVIRGSPDEFDSSAVFAVVDSILASLRWLWSAALVQRWSDTCAQLGRRERSGRVESSYTAVFSLGISSLARFAARRMAADAVEPLDVHSIGAMLAGLQAVLDVEVAQSFASHLHVREDDDKEKGNVAEAWRRHSATIAHQAACEFLYALSQRPQTMPSDYEMRHLIVTFLAFASRRHTMRVDVESVLRITEVDQESLDMQGGELPAASTAPQLRASSPLNRGELAVDNVIGKDMSDMHAMALCALFGPRRNDGASPKAFEGFGQWLLKRIVFSVGRVAVHFLTAMSSVWQLLDRELHHLALSIFLETCGKATSDSSENVQAAALQLFWDIMVHSRRQELIQHKAKLVAALTPVLRVTSHPVPRIFATRCYQYFVLALPPGHEQSYLLQGLVRHLCSQILLVTSGVEFVTFGLWWCLYLFPNDVLYPHLPTILEAALLTTSSSQPQTRAYGAECLVLTMQKCTDRIHQHLPAVCAKLIQQLVSHCISSSRSQTGMPEDFQRILAAAHELDAGAVHVLLDPKLFEPLVKVSEHVAATFTATTCPICGDNPWESQAEAAHQLGI